ncbi:MAG: prepilin peptidase [Ruminococcus sp.]|nr:prepilin peptidase [Ruminococcus sp.]MBR1739027.1 prepilin peptidase [Ruminococcus sp.]
MNGLPVYFQIMYVIIYAFAFLFGVSIGSFLNVCIYRLPIGESLTKKNSHCMTCGTPIRKRDLIPVISWCMLRGKCHSCGSRISPRYTVVELLNGILYLFVFLFYRIDITRYYETETVLTIIHASIVCLLFSALIVVFFMDWDTQLINTYVVIFIGALAVPDYLICRSILNVSLVSHIVGAFVVSVPLLIIVLASHEKAMGMGDVYLMIAGGLFLGIKGALVAMLIALVTGSISGLILKKINGDSQFAFGPYLSLGIAAAALWGENIGNWYIHFTGLDSTGEEMIRTVLTLIS